MGVKVKKEVKKTVNTEEAILSKFALVIPSMGLIFLATMGTYLSAPAIQANAKVSMVFMALMALGAIFALFTYMWRMKLGEKGVSVMPFLRGERTLFYDAIKKVEVHRIGDIVIYYSIIRKNDRVFARVYCYMTNCGEMLERLRKLGVKIVEA